MPQRLNRSQLNASASYTRTRVCDVTASRVVRMHINSSHSLSRVSLQADLTFRAMIVAADDYGRLDGRTEILKGLLFPLRTSATPARLAQWISELTAGEDPPVVAYRVGGRPYLFLTGWEEHRGQLKRRHKPEFPAPPGVPDPIPASCVYFVRDPGTGRIKIGWTGDIASRLSSLRTANPDLELLGSIPAETRAEEKQLHRRFAAHRAGREWFEPHDDLISYIEGLSHGVPVHDGTARDRPSGVGGGEGEGIGGGVGVVGSSPTGSVEKPTPPKKASPEGIALAELLASELVENLSHVSIPATVDRWALEADRMLRGTPSRPAIPRADIERVIRWVVRDDFERANVHSFGKLSKRFAQLHAKATSTGPVSAAERRADATKAAARSVLRAAPRAES